MTMKHTISVAVILASSLASAWSPLATQKWVEQFFSERQNSQGTSISPRPEAFSRTVTGNAAIGGETTTLSTRLSSPESVSFEVISSSVDGIPDGTRYSFDSTLGTFDNPSVSAMPTIRFDRTQTTAETTNAIGFVSAVTNVRERYSASVSGTPFRSTVHRGIRYLVGQTGMRGPKIAYCLQLRHRQTTSVAGRMSPFSAYADGTYPEPQDGIWGSVEIGTITWTKNGIEYEFTGDYSGSFTIGQFDSLGKFCLATLDLFENGDANAIQSSAELLRDSLNDPRNWGLFPDDSNKMTGTDGKSITYSAFKDSEFWNNVTDSVSGPLMEEYWRIINAYFEGAMAHNCPHSDGPWTPDDNCMCKFTYRDRSGQIVKCPMHTVKQHIWSTFSAVDGNLVLSDVGCSLCARCHQASPEEGAAHVTVPDSDDLDWCGCFCQYFYSKKEKGGEQEITGAETIETETPPAISHRNTRCVDRAGKYFLEYAA